MRSPNDGPGNASCLNEVLPLMNEKPNNFTPPIEAISEDVRSLVDGYMTDTISLADIKRLEEVLRTDATARRFFVRYTMLDRDLHLEVHARKQGDAALARIGFGYGFDQSESTSLHTKPGAQRSVAPGLAVSATRFRTLKPIRWLAAAAA
ncbi:MAG: hypothetical protein JWR85_3960, partial [Marmoricola sp.]|nr:hypothetical protein [Marmoricola sp.]